MDDLERRLNSEALKSRGKADDRPYATSSVPLDMGEYPVAIGVAPYRVADAELAAMSPLARQLVLKHREREASYRAAAAAKMQRELEARQRLVRLQNRAAALQEVDGVFYTRCACGWCGLRVADPEVARREYDEHACAINGDAPVERAIAETNRVQLEKRTTAEATVDAIEGTQPVADHQVVEIVDDTAQRMQLLELK